MPNRAALARFPGRARGRTRRRSDYTTACRAHAAAGTLTPCARIRRRDILTMPPVSLTPLLQGLGLGASLIIAIGAQNAFVLRQSLKRQHVFITALICTLCDAGLIALGVGGLGLLIANIPALTIVATWGGAAFLLFYGFRSFRAAAAPGVLEVSPVTAAPARVWNIVLATLAISLLT